MYNNKPQQEGRSLLLEVDKAPLVSVGLSLFLRAGNLACNSWLLVDTSLTFLGTPPIIAGQQLHLFYLQGYDDQCCLRAANLIQIILSFANTWTRLLTFSLEYFQVLVDKIPRWQSI